ncbi:hypothetical protein PFISCL1PPCAC_9966, partial [Pristionchus fissidentatus]
QMPGKSVTLPPETGGGGEEAEVRPSPVASFLRKMGGRVMGRGRSPAKKSREEIDEGREKSSKSTSKSPARFVGQTLQRLSMRRKEKISLCEEDPSPSTRDGPMTTPRGLPPRPAISENDLRNITIRRGSSDIPITPLAGATTFMSEDNLASGECGGTPYRTPSYVRISCTLNGYRSPSRLNQTPITTTPTRPKTQANGMGKSLVERRLDQLRAPRPGVCPGTPPVTSSPDSRTAYSDCPSTPAVSQSTMGNAACTPTPIKSLISHFDKLKICSTDEEQKENVKPHSLVINEQPVGIEGEGGEKKDPSRLQFDEDEAEKKRREEEKERLEKRLDGGEEKVKEEEEEVNHNVIKVMPKNVPEAEQPVVRDGVFFVSLLATTRATLTEMAKTAEEELDRLQSELSDPAAALLRIVIGKATLLNGKKLKKFDELVQKNLHPRADDPQPATVDDLEGYWGLVEIELLDIAASIRECDEWRERGWTPREEEEKSPSQTSRDGSDSGRGASEASSRPSSRGRVAPKSAVPRPAPVQSEKAREAAEKRRKEMAEMKARMRKEKEEKKNEEEGQEKAEDGGVLMVL